MFKATEVQMASTRIYFRGIHDFECYRGETSTHCKQLVTTNSFLHSSTLPPSRYVCTASEDLQSRDSRSLIMLLYRASLSA